MAQVPTMNEKSKKILEKKKKIEEEHPCLEEVDLEGKSSSLTRGAKKQQLQKN